MSEAMLDRPIAGNEAALDDAARGATWSGLDARTAGGTSQRSTSPRATAAAVRHLARADLSPFQRRFRHWFSRTVSAVVIRTWFRVRVEHPEHFQSGPAVYCFNHLSWLDPLLLLSTFPSTPRLYFYGPKEENLRVGIRNRFMWWTTIPVPFSPRKDDLLTSIRRAQAVFASGDSLAIAPEGTIHVHEGDLLAFEEGAAYLALRAGVPIVPVAITGTAWVRFGGRVRVRLGEPIPTGQRPTRGAVAHFSALAWHAIHDMVAEDRDAPPPGRLGRWLTDLFNDWGDGGRPAATSLRGPDPAAVPIPPVGARRAASGILGHDERNRPVG